MSAFTVRPQQFRKVQGDVRSLGSLDKTEIVEAIVKVKEPDYVPDGVKVRSRIDSRMLTGELPTDILRDLEDDPKVEAVSISRRLRVIE
jgi:hypothetical protein